MYDVHTYSLLKRREQIAALFFGLLLLAAFLAFMLLTMASAAPVFLKGPRGGAVAFADYFCAGADCRLG